MKKALFLLIIFAFTLSPIYGQNGGDKDKKEGKKAKAKKYTVYAEMALEDFETNNYETEKHLKFTVTRYQKGGIITKDVNKDKTAYPAPTGKSKKYIGIKFFGKARATGSDVLKIIPAKEIKIDKHCKEISIWVYGKRMKGELSMMLRDARGRNHRLVFGRLGFLGWRKLKVRLTRRIKQSDAFLNQKSYMQILHFQYRPGNISQVPLWHYFYLDDISAMVRDKYIDRQNDDW